jgi:hypothetical protein
MLRKMNAAPSKTSAFHFTCSLEPIEFIKTSAELLSKWVLPGTCLAQLPLVFTNERSLCYIYGNLEHINTVVWFHVIKRDRNNGLKPQTGRCLQQRKKYST